MYSLVRDRTGEQGKQTARVEDDEALRGYAVEALGELGYRVQSAPDAASALQALKGQRPDLLFTDVVMPDRKSVV